MLTVEEIEAIISIYLIDMDDGGRWNIVDKLFSGYTKYIPRKVSHIYNYPMVYHLSHP